jgi:hypothetical protein
MKTIHIISAAVVCLVLSACYSEAPLTPSDNQAGTSITFPQGDDTWDHTFLDIYNRYGVYLIYKDITDEAFNKSWTGGVNQTILHAKDCPNDEMKQFYATFMQKHVFNYLTPELTNRVFPMYWYMVYNLTGNSLVGLGSFTSDIYSGASLMDCWVTCFFKPASAPAFPYEWCTPYNQGEGARNSYDARRFVNLNLILSAAITRGNIVVPPSFDSGFDHSTLLNVKSGVNNESDPNYYLNRGYIDGIGQIYGDTIVSQVINPAPPTKEAAFLNYMQILMRFRPDKRAEEYPADKYPMIHEKMGIVLAYLKQNYGLDLDAIANGPDDWAITPYPDSPETEETK